MLREFCVCDIWILDCTGKVLGLNVGNSIVLICVNFGEMLGKKKQPFQNLL
jgi:hypothetical protein